MRLIHCADIHLGSKMEAKLPKNKADERRAEVRDTFSRMVRWACEQGVCAILLAGDVFDSDRPLKRDKEFFYSVVRANPHLDFVYLRGNHDRLASYTEEGLPNLRPFYGEWGHYRYGNVTVSGIEMEPGNALSLYSTLRLNPAEQNVVMLHGQAGDRTGVDLVNLTLLRDKSIDYLALGHLHAHAEERLDARGVYAYSGCLEGRGFDEIGEKGFVLLESDGTMLRRTFVPFARRTVREISVDLSGTENAYEATQRARKIAGRDAENLLRIRLTGTVSYDRDTLARDVEAALASDFYFVSAKDETAERIDTEVLAGKMSLAGEFVRGVMQNGAYSEEERQEIVALGLKALNGWEVDTPCN